LEFEPGTEYRYSNSGYFVLGAVIEKVTGKAYDAALREYVLDPLELNDTGYEHNGDVLPRFASGYSRGWDGFERAAYLDTSIPYSAGMLYSTVDDLLQWTDALHAGSVFTSGKTLTTMTMPRVAMTADSTGPHYGYGLYEQAVSVAEGAHKFIGHTGGIFGFTSALFRGIDDPFTIVLLDNTEQGIAGRPFRGIVNILYDEAPPPPMVPVAEFMYKAIQSDGLEAASAKYWIIKSDSTDAYALDEWQLNRLGYHYLRGGDLQKAIGVFRLNVEAFPEAANPYDSLGEAYMKAGQTEAAIENYRKTLELNPDNENARNMLRQMGEEVAEPKTKPNSED
jgi:tetratricopeptide (TPR) repeat protein